jgi:hypothetical protein
MESVAMSRPTVVNTRRQPIPPINMEELKFWLRIMEEHALFVKAGLPCENTGLINQAETFQQEFATLQAQAEGAINERKFAELVADAREVVGDFYRYNRQLLHLALTCQILGCNFALFLDHISREAEYVLRLLEKLAVGQSPLYQVSSAREVDFWLRLMADHAEFVLHRLDPSERNLIDTSATFASEFDELYLQGRDYVSMLRGETQEVPSYRRFMKDARVATLRLRDFMRAAEVLITECKLVGLIPALLADHMRREADHFLLVLAFLEKGSYVPFDEDGDIEYLNLEENIAAAQAAPAIPHDEGSKTASVQTGNYAGDDADDEEDDDTPEYLVRPQTAAAPAVPKQPVRPIAPSSPVLQTTEAVKYQWSGKWPRPLGGKPIK